MCCGKNRALIKATSKSAVTANIARYSTAPIRVNASFDAATPAASQSHSQMAKSIRGQSARMPQQNVSFAYLGNTKMTVVGPATGFEYSFDRPGARLYVDPRDRAALAAIRQLRQVW